MSSRLIYNLFSKELWAQLWQSLLEVSIIVDIVLLFFFFTSTWLITSVCSMKTQRATRTVVHGVLWAISQMPPDVLPLHSMAVAAPPACGGRQSRFCSEFPSLLLFAVTVYIVLWCRVWAVQFNLPQPGHVSVFTQFCGTHQAQREADQRSCFMFTHTWVRALLQIACPYRTCRMIIFFCR